jgi:hypothetical protein
MSERWRKPKPAWVRNMEDALGEYYGEPVRPVSQYCDAFEMWAKCLLIRAGDAGTQRDASLDGALAAIASLTLPIRKSSYLARRIYGGERHRIAPCPEHKGEWMGLELPDNRCPHGCHLTGWIYAGKDGDAA